MENFLNFNIAFYTYSSNFFNNITSTAFVLNASPTPQHFVGESGKHVLWVAENTYTILHSFVIHKTPGTCVLFTCAAVT